MAHKRTKKRKKNSDDDMDEDSECEVSRVTSSARTAHSNPTSSKGKKRHEKHDLNILLAQDDAEAYRQGIPCWTSIRASATPNLAPRPFCTVCGYVGLYKCVACLLHKPTPFTRYLCSAACMVVHKDTDCCKTKNLVRW